MRSAISQLSRGLLMAVVSGLIVIGSISLALAEGGLLAAPPPTEPPATATNLPPTAVIVVGETPQPTETPTPTHTASPVPPTNCPPPSGWVPVTIQAGDTLADLARRYNTLASALSDANCLFSSELIPGSIMYVPPLPTATSIPCGPPRGWIIYIVKSGDTLFSLGRAYGVTVQELQFANCLGSSTLIRTGDELYVPNVPTRTPTPTPTTKPVNTQPATSTPTRTPTPVTPTPTNTPTNTPVTPTNTPVTPTITPTPSNTPVTPAAPPV